MPIPRSALWNGDICLGGRILFYWCIQYQLYCLKIPWYEFSSFLWKISNLKVLFSVQVHLYATVFPLETWITLLIYSQMRPSNQHLRHHCIWHYRLVGIVSSLIQILCYLSTILTLEEHSLTVSPYVKSCPSTFSVHVFYINPMFYSTGDLTYFLGK